MLSVSPPVHATPAERTRARIHPCRQMRENYDRLVLELGVSPRGGGRAADAAAVSLPRVPHDPQPPRLLQLSSPRAVQTQSPWILLHHLQSRPELTQQRSRQSRR